MEYEDYGNLPLIIEDALRRASAQGEMTLELFYGRMEEEFQRLGYRDNPEGKFLQKILILRLDAVGDFILATPAIRAIRENFPRAFITLVVTKSVYPMAELCPYVNEVIPFDTPFTSSLDNHDRIGIFANAIDFSVQYLLRRHFDACFSFVDDDTHSVLSYLSGASIRVGYVEDKNLFTHKVRINHLQVPHCCEKNLYLLQSIGLQINSAELELWYGLEDLHRAKNILGDFAPDRVKVAVGVGASIATRKYPIEKYLIAFREIMKKGAALVIVGGSSEFDDAKFLEDNLPAEYVKNTVKFKPSWRTTSAIISLTDMYIGNDTGTQHVAAALKKPVILVSRVAKNTDQFMTKLAPETSMFRPWQTRSIVLRPEYQLDECEERHEFIGCIRNEAHCITQIEPSEIVAAYEEILR